MSGIASPKVFEELKRRGALFEIDTITKGSSCGADPISIALNFEDEFLIKVHEWFEMFVAFQMDWFNPFCFYHGTHEIFR